MSRVVSTLCCEGHLSEDGAEAEETTGVRGQSLNRGKRRGRWADRQDEHMGCLSSLGK